MSASNFQEFGHPYIQTCISGSFPWVDRYNSIVQNEEGYVFIGARNGILRSDGSSWTCTPAKGNLKLVNHRGEVLAYSKNRLCRLANSPDGGMMLVDTLVHENNLNGSISQVLSAGDSLYILSTQDLYILRNGIPVEINTGFRVSRLISFMGSVLLESQEHDFHILSGNQIRQAELPAGPGTPECILPLGNGTLFIERQGKNPILWAGGDSIKILGSSHNFPVPSAITCAAWLGRGILALGTSGKGILIASDKGEILTRITTSEGLYGNDIVQLLSDAFGNLWALHEQAISRIEIPSVFSHFDPGNGLYGDVRSVLRHRGVLYAATSRGLYRLQAAESSEGGSRGTAVFAQVPGVDGICHCLASTGEKLAVGGVEGLYLVSGESVRKVLPVAVNVLFYEPGLDILLAGTESGLRMIHLANGQEIRNFSLPNVSIDGIVHLPSGILWLSSRSGVIYRSSRPMSLEGDPGYSSFTSDDLQSIQGSFIDLVNFSGRLYFSGSNGLFTFDSRKGSFSPDTVFSFPLERGTYRIRQIHRDEENIVWIGIDGLVNSRAKVWTGSIVENGSYMMQPLTYRRLENLSINCIYPDQGNITWIGTQEGLLRYDPGFKRLDPPPSRTHITRISIGDLPAAGVLYPDGVKIPHKSDKIRFDFISTDYNCESSKLYQYRMAGLNDQWSEWIGNSYEVFSELPAGKYEFQVRSQDIYGMVSLPDSYSFRIRPPFFSAWYAWVIYSFLLLLGIYILRRWRHLQELREQYHLEEVVQERTESIIKEKEKAEDLIANILPKTTADELKARGKVTSSKFKMVTVLFADIQGFTKIAEQMNPDKLIDQLDRFYFHFDSVVEKYNIEKIKTIGDAYMAAGGIPIKNRTNPVDVVLAALEMQQYMKELKKTHSDIWDLRIGIHTGSVIAGVVGQKKYSYDIWGDTVNTASRMESSGEAGRVNISATTYKLIKDFFQCEFRGKMPVKYKGDIAMFFVNGLNPTYSETDRVTPNDRLFIQVQLLRLLDLEETVLERLEKELPENLFFHNVEHTSHVYAQVELLGRGEKVSDEDLLTLRTAALLHDVGYIDRVDDHESRSVEIAREILPLYRYSEKQIDQICELIMATRMPPEPKNLLEQIICDANLDHVGRVDFLIQSDKLFQEYRIQNRIRSKKDWNQFQINFLENHEFFTSIARRMREVPRERQIENIKQFS